MFLVLPAAWLALAPLVAPAPGAPPPATQVTPFRTEAQPRVDPVFGDAATLRQAVDRFFALQAEMDRVRDEFSTSVHETLGALNAAGAAKTCPATTAGPYARALAAGTRYLSLGQQMQARFRDIRRAEDLGDAVALTPDYRAKVKRARDLHQHLLDDYREMRVAFYDQLGAEMHHASCKTGVKAVAAADGGAPAPNPLEASAWTIDEPATIEEAPAPAPTARGAVARVAPTPAGKPTPVRSGEGAPAIWIDVDNTLCAQATRVSVDGQPLGEVGARKRTSVRTHAGPREICALPASDPRGCGDPGTIRKAYLHEGWSLTVHCAR
jgi:hypothetical protein